MTEPADPAPPAPPLPRGRFYRLAWTLYLILALAGVIWIGLRSGSIPLSLFLRRETALVDLGLGVAAGGLLVAVWVLIRRIAPAARELERELSLALGPIDRSEVVALALLSGLAEELFFRGAMQGALGWPLATAVFTLLHTGPGRVYRVWTLFAAIAGLLFAGLVVWRQSLLPAVTAHVLVNAVNLWRLQLPRAKESTG